MMQQNIAKAILTGLGILLVVGVWVLLSTSKKQTTLEQSATVSFEIAQGVKGSEDHDHKENYVLVSPKEIAEFDIKVETAGSGKLETYISLPGEIVVNADRLAHIVPRVSGVVREVRVNLGDIVQAGEIMAILESSELAEAKTEYFQRNKQLEINEIDLFRLQTIHDNTQVLLHVLKKTPASATGSKKNLPDIESVLSKTEGLDMGENRRLLISTYTNFLLTQETYKREKKLYEKKISSHSDYLLAKRNFKNAQASYVTTYDEVSFSIKRQLLEKKRAAEVARTSLRAAERHLHVLGVPKKEIQNPADGEEQDSKVARVEISAPITGTVIEKYIAFGEMLKNDAQAFVLADLKSVWVDFRVYRKNMPLIRKGLEVVISAGQDLPDAKGAISYVRSIVGEETRTTLVRVVLLNPDGLWRPGLFVTGKVVAREISVPLVVPKTALQTIEEQTVVFVKTNEGFRPQPVTTGHTNGTYIEVLSGITPGQQYVAQGGFTLKAQLSKNDFDSEDGD